MKQNGVTYDDLRLFLFPYSLTHHATAWFDRLPKNSTHTFEEMVSKFLSKYFPPSMVTKLKNDITQRGDSSRLITSSSHVIAALTQQIAKMNKKFLRLCQSNQPVNMVNPSCETCGGPHHYSKCRTAGGFTQGDVYAAMGNYNIRENQLTKLEKAFNERPQGALSSNTIPNPREDIKLITTRSGITLVGPSIPPPNHPSSSNEVERDQEPTIIQVRIVLKCAKITKNRTISTQDQKPQRKAKSGSKFSVNNLTMKLNLSKVQV
nr:reverse transcriptase domain-containing protein [Tanacetum cinerariifolium]